VRGVEGACSDGVRDSSRAARGRSYRSRASARVTWGSASADRSFTAMRRAANGKRCKGRSDAARLLMEGNSSKGVSLRLGEGGHDSVVLRDSRGGAARNGSNPMAGSGMQQARDPVCGESRRGGEKPRGRNVIWRVEPSDRERPRPLGVDAHVNLGFGRGGCRWRGEHQSGEEMSRSGSPGCEGHRPAGSACRVVKATKVDIVHV